MPRTNQTWPLLLALAFLLTASCGDDDSATGPRDEELIGRWQFASTDLVDRILEKLIPFLQGLGATEEDIDATREEFLADTGAEGFFSPGYSVDLKADHTWDDSAGDTGTWRTSGDLLTMESDGEVPPMPFHYTASADRLTLALSSPDLLELMRSEGSLDEETETFLSLFFTPEDEFTIVMSRVE
ncbi:MAG: hypothetical protein HOC74_40370 [Gemmatimonadetes bacterium]|jgi:hypothetical protein|nr:hypothetical protein [Gemmatimonadota bacterium]